MISASEVTTRHELIMSLVAGLSLIKARCGAERSAPAYPSRACSGKLVLPEQGCLGQGGCEAKPDYARCEDQPLNKAVDKEGRE